MQFFSDLTSHGVSLDGLLKFSDLDSRVQKHVQKVYVTLAASLVAVALGVYTDALLRLGGIFTFLVGMGCLFGLSWTPSTREKLGQRYALLGAFAFFDGLSIGPLVNSINEDYPSVVLTAFLLTLTVFVSFSMSALVAKRRSMLYLTSFCSIGLLGLSILSLGSSLLGGRAWTYRLELYLGLIIFSVYVLVDTQMLVERASAGDFDHVKAALQFLLDFINIFIRVLIILADKKDKEERSSDRKKNR